MATAGAAALAFILVLFAAGCAAFSEENPTDQRILVVLDDMGIKNTHSLFFGSLAARGYSLDFKTARDSSLAVKKYGLYLYDAAIIFAPKSHSFAGSLDLNGILDFIDSGHDLILAGDVETSDLIRDLATECGADMDEEFGALVVDHQKYARVPGEAVDHTLVEAAEVINASVIVGSAPLRGPVVYRGLGLAVSPSSELVLPILSASPSAYTSDSRAALSSSPSLRGSGVTLVAATQARNNARVLISGSLSLFSDKFFRMVLTVSDAVPKEEGKATKTSAWVVPSGNEQFAVEVSKWVFHERGHLKAVNLTHHRTGDSDEPAVYRITDHLDFSVDMFEWSGKEWVPYVADDVQVQLYMMSPYVLKALTTDGKGKFYTSFQVPDVYGVFQFKVIYKRLGYATISLAKQIPIRPFRHDEFERFIPAAFPYYASAFSMMAGFFVFGFVFLYHK